MEQDISKVLKEVANNLGAVQVDLIIVKLQNQDLLKQNEALKVELETLRQNKIKER